MENIKLSDELEARIFKRISEDLGGGYVGRNYNSVKLTIQVVKDELAREIMNKDLNLDSPDKLLFD